MATANLLQTSVSGGTQNALSLQGDGVFFPKASTTSRLALTLTTTDKGFIVYDTTDNNIYFWNGAAWESVPSSGDAGANGSVQYNDNGIVSGATNFVWDKVNGRVGIGTASPAYPLSVAGRISYSSGIGEGADLTVSSSSTTLQFGLGSSWVAQSFYLSGSTAMTLDSTGLGIGGSAAYKLDVVGPVMRLINSAATADIFITDSGTTNGNVRLRGESNALKFITGGGVSATIDASGNLAIGVAATGTRRLEVKSAGTSNTTFAAHFRDSADTLLFQVRSDGYFNTGQGALSPYSNTTGSAANMFVDSSGFVYRSTSSLKYKTDVKDSIHGLADVLKLRSVTYKSKNGDDTVFGGLIAEEVHAAGLTEFVAYAPDKTPDSINYGNMVALLVSAIQELTARVKTLESR